MAVKLFYLRNKVFESLSSIEGIEINGSMENRLSHNISLYIEGVEAKALINEVKEYLAISAGSACTADNINPSHVIIALGYDEDRAFSTVRFGLGRFTTEEDINKAIRILIPAIKKLKNL